MSKHLKNKYLKHLNCGFGNINAGNIPSTTKKLNDDFYFRVYEVISQIPYGKVTTYGAIARALGISRSARLVGMACAAAAGNLDLPFHRVVNRNGELTGKHNFPTPDFMEKLLIAEGVKFVNGHVDLKNFLWEPEIY